MSVDLPTLGRPTIAIRRGCSGACAGSPPSSSRPARAFPACVLDRRGKVADADIVLGRDRKRFAEAERIGFVERGFGRASLALVDGENDRLAGSPRKLGEVLVGRHHARPPVDEEQHEIGACDRRFRLLAHARRQSLIAGLESRRIDEPEGAGAKRCIGLAPVARQTRLVVHEREFPPREPVEQGGLADIRPSNDGDGEGHRKVTLRTLAGSREPAGRTS